MKRPICEWTRLEERCRSAATHVVTFVHNDRSCYSCAAHTEDWQRRGRGWFVSKLQGFCGDWNSTINDMLTDNQAIGEARKAGALRLAYEHQLERIKALAAKI